VFDDSFLSCRAPSDTTPVFSWSAEGKIYVINPEYPYAEKEFNATSSILGVTCNSNCSKALSWDVDHNVKIWNLSGNSPPIVLRHDAAVTGALFSPSEDQVLSWGGNGTATLWQLSSRRVIRVFRHVDTTNAGTGSVNLAASVGHLEAQMQKSGEVCSASLSPNESLVITAGSDASAHLWSISKNTSIFTYNGSGALRGTRFTSHGDYAICWGDREIAWFQTEVAKSPNSLRTVAASFVQGVELDDAEQRILTWTRGGDFGVYEFPSGLLLGSFEQIGTVNGAKMSPDGKSILCWDNTGIVTQWNPLGSPKPRKFDLGNPVAGAMMSDDESELLAYSNDGLVRVWNISTGGLIRSFKVPGQLSGAIFVTADRKIVTWEKGGIVRLWNPSPKGDFHSPPLNGEIQGAKFFENGSNILAWRADGSGGIWSFDNSRPFWTFNSREPISGIILNPTNLDFFSWSPDGTIRMWHPPLDESRLSIDLSGGVSGISLSADNSCLLAWNRNGLGTIWSLPAGHKIYDFREFEMVGAKFAPSGSNFLTWSAAGSVSVYSLTARATLAVGRHDDAILGVEWKSDARAVLTWSVDGTAKLWHINNMSHPIVLKSSKPILGAKFNQKCDRIVTWGQDNKIGVWRVDGGVLMKEIQQPCEPKGVAFDNDGESIWTWSDDGRIFLWRSAELGRSFRQPASIDNFILDPKSEHFLTAGADSVIRYFSVSRGEPICTLRQAGTPTSFVINRGKVFTLGDDGQAGVWDLSVLPGQDLRQKSLELEVRSATVLDNKGDLLPLSANDLQRKSRQLPKQAAN